MSESWKKRTCPWSSRESAPFSRRRFPKSARCARNGTPCPKKRRKTIRRIIALVVLVAIAIGLFKVFGGKGKQTSTVVTDIVQYGSITSTLEGSGLTKAKKSETITLTTAVTVQEVLVSEGEKVTAGTPLFTIDSEAARTAVEKSAQGCRGL